MGNVPEPSTKHYLDRDIFTHITYADLESLDSASQEMYGEPDTLNLSMGDSLFTSNSVVKLVDFERKIDKKKFNLDSTDIALGLNITAKPLGGKIYSAMPIMVIRGNQIFSIEDDIDELGLEFRFHGVNPETEKLTVLLAEKNANAGDFVIMQAIVFPYINILWLGCIIMFLGTLVAVINRVRTNNSGK